LARTTSLLLREVRLLALLLSWRLLAAAADAALKLRCAAKAVTAAARLLCACLRIRAGATAAAAKGRRIVHACCAVAELHCLLLSCMMDVVLRELQMLLLLNRQDLHSVGTTAAAAEGWDLAVLRNHQRARRPDPRMHVLFDTTHLRSEAPARLAARGTARMVWGHHPDQRVRLRRMQAASDDSAASNGFWIE
jgi:hypothetical protein